MELLPADQNCCVVIPVYKEQLNEAECLSLNQCLRVLCNHPITLAAPQSLDTKKYLELSPHITVKRFADFYFNNIEGYNKLMLSKKFYKHFTDYKYILIYQLDAWIFKDELEYWCSKDYDYIGAPWLDHWWASFAAGHITFIRTFFHKLGYRKFNLVGNGGFSLRKVRSAIFNLGLYRYAAGKFKGNEDYFFSFFINSYNPFFKIPPANEALNFSFDVNPAECYSANGFKLPMGCHGWNKHLDFWKAFIH